MRMRHPLLAGPGIAALLVLALTPAEAACPTSGPKPVPGTLAATAAGCDVKKSAPPPETRRKGDPNVIRYGNTEIRMRGYMQMDAGTGGGFGTGR
jgi:hypothetical protein